MSRKPVTDTGVVSRGRSNTGLEFICWSFKSQTFFVSLIELQSDLVKSDCE